MFAYTFRRRVSRCVLRIRICSLRNWSLKKWIHRRVWSPHVVVRGTRVNQLIKRTKIRNGIITTVFISFFFSPRHRSGFRNFATTSSVPRVFSSFPPPSSRHLNARSVSGRHVIIGKRTRVFKLYLTSRHKNSSCSILVFSFIIIIIILRQIGP